jgi:hypothetical protein
MNVDNIGGISVDYQWWMIGQCTIRMRNQKVEMSSVSIYNRSVPKYSHFVIFAGILFKMNKYCTFHVNILSNLKTNLIFSITSCTKFTTLS